MSPPSLPSLRMMSSSAPVITPLPVLPSLRSSLHRHVLPHPLNDVIKQHPADVNSQSYQPDMNLMRLAQQTEVGTTEASRGNGQKRRRNSSSDVFIKPNNVESSHGSSDSAPDDEADLGMANNDPGASKKARRKEQCRVNQANYRKRKRAHELQLAGCIKSLEGEIEELVARKVELAQVSSLTAHRQLSPEEAIAEFYYVMQGPFERCRPSQHYPVSLVDLQSQEFQSLHELREQWLLYRQIFEQMELHVLTTERIEAGENVIVKVIAELHVQVFVDERNKRGRSTLICPVQQRFEFSMEDNIVSRITCEVDSVAGVVACMHRHPEVVVRVLQDLTPAGHHVDV